MGNPPFPPSLPPSLPLPPFARDAYPAPCLSGILCLAWLEGGKQSDVPVATSPPAAPPSPPQTARNRRQISQWRPTSAAHPGRCTSLPPRPHSPLAGVAPVQVRRRGAAKASQALRAPRARSALAGSARAGRRSHRHCALRARARARQSLGRRAVGKRAASAAACPHHRRCQRSPSLSKRPSASLRLRS